MGKKRKSKSFIVIYLIFVVALLGFVLGTTPVWQGDLTNYSVSEDLVYYHNLSKNITEYNNDILFEILPSAGQEIYLTNATGRYSVTKEFISSWIKIYNSSTGNLTFNASYDNQSGFFEIPINAINTSDSDAASPTTTFEFQVNATNDYPSFTNINNSYTFSTTDSLLDFLNASDEELHYPLNFTIVFNETNCTHADWSGRNVNENCSLYNFNFTLTSSSNTSALLNFTPVLNDVGEYWANISVTDFNATCPHSYCDATMYEQNLTTYYSTMVKFTIQAGLDINITDCENKIYNERQEFACDINITTPGTTDSINISTNASLRNYGENLILNRSWFHADESATSTGNIYTVNINVTPTKNEIGNWSINFSVDDTTENIQDSILINFVVAKNNSLEDIPNLDAISNVETSIDLPTIINLTAYDNDFLIPDKNSTALGGYKEKLTFYVDILSSTSTINETFTINSYSSDKPITSGGKLTNKTISYINFTSNSSESGNYALNITVQDVAGNNNSKFFDLVILNNSAPQWSLLLDTIFLKQENETLILNFSQNVSDEDNDTLTFTYELLDGYSFEGFSVDSNTGEINITFNDSHVGEHLVNIIVNDSYLTNTTTFNFTITNINDNVSIVSFTAVEGFTGDANDNINMTEDINGRLDLLLEDSDLLIPENQKSFYNETLIVNVTFINSTYHVVNDLFNFSLTIPPTVPIGVNSDFRLSFEANFTPNQTQVGNYSVTINVSDNNATYDVLQFNLTIISVEDAPVMQILANQTTGVNRSWNYDILSTDAEDGEESSGLLVYSYNFLSGNDFINNNETIFNTTYGNFTFTFNDSHAGKYHINVTVNDSTNSTDSDDFWLFVYGKPSVILPTSIQTFSAKENETENLTFQVNHSVGDELRYLFYIENSSGVDVLKDNVTYFGNSTNYTWAYTSGFIDETYGNVTNLTLVVFPTNNDLTNVSEFNTTTKWNITINHTNAPMTFGNTNLGEQSIAYTSAIEIDLSGYFSDVDVDDVYYNQSLNFSISSNTTPTNIQATMLDWTITFSPIIQGVTSEFITINLSDINATTNLSLTSDASNPFEVKFTEPVTITTPTTTTKKVDVPVSLKLIMPDPVSAFKRDKIVLPIKLYNNGGKDLKGINLSGLIVKDAVLREDFNLSFTNNFFDEIKIGETVNTTLIIEIDTNVLGLYEVTVNATVESPDFEDWGKFFLTIEEDENVKERLLFTEQLILENPECIELTEIVNEAKKFFEEGDFVKSILKINQATEACKQAIAQVGKLKVKDTTTDKIYFYIFISTIVVFFAGVSYYFFKRMKLKKSSLKFEEEVLEKQENLK